uniref:TSNAXIP1_N domain-containing protein n=1 Tax=Steinernema glaseri TaxID=37863 RepID=A0A1I7YA86_9BILA
MVRPKQDVIKGCSNRSRKKAAKDTELISQFNEYESSLSEINWDLENGLIPPVFQEIRGFYAFIDAAANDFKSHADWILKQYEEMEQALSKYVSTPKGGRLKWDCPSGNALKKRKMDALKRMKLLFVKAIRSVVKSHWEHLSEAAKSQLESIYLADSTPEVEQIEANVEVLREQASSSGAGSVDRAELPRNPSVEELNAKRQRLHDEINNEKAEIERLEAEVALRRNCGSQVHPQLIHDVNPMLSDQRPPSELSK